MIKRILKDPQIRRFVSGSAFAGAFVWVAVTQFRVDTEVVWTFFLMSFVFVGGMIVIGLVLAPLFRLMNRRPNFVPKNIESDAVNSGADGPKASDETQN